MYPLPPHACVPSAVVARFSLGLAARERAAVGHLDTQRERREREGEKRREEKRRERERERERENSEEKGRVGERHRERESERDQRSRRPGEPSGKRMIDNSGTADPGRPISHFSLLGAPVHQDQLLKYRM